MEPLTLQCWVYGDDVDVDRIFPIKISRTETVGFLKEAIKDKKAVVFHNVDANDLTLYTIPIPETDDQLDSWKSDRNSRLISRSKVSKYFPESGDTEWLIIIDAPTSAIIQPSVVVPDMTLNCWIRDTNIDNIFPVEIPRTKTVGLFKEAIKNKKAVAFQNIDANDLNLYKVCIPWNGALVQNLQNPAFKLHPLEILSDVFPDLHKKEVHIVVEGPPSGVRTGLPVAEEEDMLTPLILLATTITSNSLTPSQAAESRGYSAIQSGNQRILDCRYAKDNPVDTVAPPIQLFNPAFAFFSSHAFDSEYNVPDGVVRDVRKLMAEFAQIHTKEDNRRSNLRLSLAKVINYPLLSLNDADKTSPDLVATGKCGELQTYLVVAEDKNEFGDGGSDPSVQAAFSFQRIICQEENEEIRLRCCCPAFTIAHAGPWLAIMGGIIPGGCIVQRLTDFFWIPVHSTHDDTRSSGLRAESIECLDSWYQDTVKKVPPFKLSSRVPHPRFFPSPNAYRDGDNLVRFEYQEPLELDVSCVTYRAKTLGDNPKDIVVKFVTSYGADAHREMALASLAPEFLYYGEINVEPGMPSYGGLRMVVMEYVDGLTLNKAWEQRKVSQNFQSDLRNAFKHLHDAGHVYGDLRQPNVMITREGKIQLIDFDWAGKEGEVKYPVAISSYINWPAGVQGLAPIRKEHDSVMLDALLNSIYGQDPYFPTN